MRKNVASQTIAFQMNSTAAGVAVTSGTPTVYYTIDGGTQGTGGGSSTHEGNGQWSYVPAQAETNGAHVAFTMALSGAISQTVNVWPVSYNPGDSDDLGLTALTGHTPQTGDSYARLGAPAGASVSADLADLPTVSEFEARTLVSADYVITSDTIAGVTLVATTTDVTNQVTADVTAISGDSTAANNAELAFDGTGFGFTNCTIPTVSTLTGHTVQTGDSFARIGAAGAGLTNINLPNQTMDITGDITGNLSGNVTGTIGELAAQAKADVNAEADTALSDYDGPTNAEMEARTPTAAQLAYIVSNAATGMPVTFTTAGGSTTVAVIDEIDGAAGSATSDQYNGRLLVFTDGTLKGVVTDITDYVGSTTTATITAIPFAPTSSHNARLI